MNIPFQLRLLRYPLAALAAAALLAAPVADAQVYKWVDDKGVVNYGSKPPAGVRAGKSTEVVEDRVSVYTPESGVVEETRRARERSAQRPPAEPRAPERSVDRATAPAAPASKGRAPSPADGPCVTGYETSCLPSPLYYDGPVVYGPPRRPPRLNQPVLPPGAIAGNVNAGAGYTAGMSTQPPPVGNAPPPRRAPGASFTLKEREDRGDRGRR